MGVTWMRYAPNIQYRYMKDGTVQFRLSVFSSTEGKSLVKVITPPEGLTNEDIKEWIKEECSEFKSKVVRKVYTYSGKMTFRDYYETVYLPKQVNIKPTTREWYEQIYNKHIKGWLGPYKLEEISRDLLQRFQASLVDKGAGTSVRTACHRTYSAVLSSAVYDRIIDFNPAQIPGVKPKQPKKKVNAMRIEEVMAFIDKVEKHDDLFWQTAIKILVHTFVRRGELCALSWEDVDFRNNRIHVHANAVKVAGQPIMVTTPKSETSVRKIPMTPQLRLALLKYRRSTIDEGYLFKNCRNPELPMDPDSLTKHMNVFCRTHKLRLCTPHVLRRSGASILKRLGVPITTIKEILGHSDIKVTEGYYIDDDEKDCADAMGRFGEEFETLTVKKTPRKKVKA